MDLREGVVQIGVVQEVVLFEPAGLLDLERAPIDRAHHLQLRPDLPDQEDRNDRHAQAQDEQEQDPQDEPAADGTDRPLAEGPLGLLCGQGERRRVRVGRGEQAVPRLPKPGRLVRWPDYRIALCPSESAALLTTAIRSPGLNGFAMKSKAPFTRASRATSTVA